MKKIKVGMVGFGNIGKVHCVANLCIPLSYNDLPFSVQIGRILRKNTTQPCPYYADGYAFSIDDLLSDEETNVIDICSPNGLHYEHAVSAVKAKKAIYLEKPICNDGIQAQNLASIVEKSNLFNQCALMYRFMPGVISMRDRIERGDIGDIIEFKLCTFHSGYVNPKRIRNWKLRNDMSGGGPLLDIGIHMADTVRLVLGEVSDVLCSMRTIIKQRPDDKTGEMATVDVEDWAWARLILENGLMGTLEVSRVASTLDQSSTINIYGTEGSMHFDAYSPKRLTVFNHNTHTQETVDVKPISPYAKHLANIFPKQTRGWLIDAHQASLMNFYYNLTEEKVLFSETPTLLEAARSQAIIDACYISAAKDSTFVKL